MLQYWTFWNMSWFLAYKLNFTKNIGPLRLSVLSTSLVGLYLTYVYPRRIKFKFKGKIYELSYKNVILFDFIFHHVPLIYLFLIDEKKNQNDVCGLNVIPPVLTWYAVNEFNKTEYDKIYGVKIKYLLGGVAFITFGYGFLKHRK